jgi:hypothetical protein
MMTTSPERPAGAGYTASHGWHRPAKRMSREVALAIVGRLTANAGLPSEKPSRLRRWDAKATNARHAIIDLMQISL